MSQVFSRVWYRFNSHCVMELLMELVVKFSRELHRARTRRKGSTSEPSGLGPSSMGYSRELQSHRFARSEVGQLATMLLPVEHVCFWGVHCFPLVGEEEGKKKCFYSVDTCVRCK